MENSLNSTALKQMEKINRVITVNFVSFDK